MTAKTAAAAEPDGRWRLLLFLSAAVLLILGTWFSGAAVSDQLRAEWGIDAVGVATLTVAVQYSTVQTCTVSPTGPCPLER